MKQFDLHRFASVLRWDFRMRRKRLLIIFAALLALYLVCAVYGFTFGLYFFAIMENTTIDEVNPCGSIVQMSLTVARVMMLVAASLMFLPEQNRSGRISLLTLPATTFEKFAARWLYAVAYTLVAALLAFVLADVLVQLFRFVAGRPAAWMTPLFVSSFGSEALHSSGTGMLGLLHVADNAAALLALHGMFVLGAVLFRRNNFIITSALFMGVSYLLILIVVFGGVLFDFFQAYNRSTWGQELSYMAVVFSLLTVSYVLAYRLFRRMQVINNNWLNV